MMVTQELRSLYDRGIPALWPDHRTRALIGEGYKLAYERPGIPIEDITCQRFAAVQVVKTPKVSLL